MTHSLTTATSVATDGVLQCSALGDALAEGRQAVHRMLPLMHGAVACRLQLQWRSSQVSLQRRAGSPTPLPR